jgi:hypothetical protein
LDPLQLDSFPAGWSFQVPDHLRQPSPSPTGSRMEEASPSMPASEQAWNSKMLSRRVRQIRTTSKAFTRFNPSRTIGYRLRVRTVFITTDMDNSLLFEGLDSYAASPGGFRTPAPGLLLRANFKELLENYQVEAGFRLPTSFNGSEYYLWMEDRKKRLDRRYTLYRKSTVQTLENAVGNPYQLRYNTLLGQYELKYPFDPFFSLRAMATLRQDKQKTLSSDQKTLEAPDYAEQRAALRLAAVYDKETVSKIYQTAVNDQPYSFLTVKLDATDQKDMFWLRWESRLVPKILPQKKATPSPYTTAAERLNAFVNLD